MCEHCVGAANAAARNRELFVDSGTLAFNLLGPDGGGKTALIEHTQDTLRRRSWRIGAVVPDVRGDDSQDRLRHAGVFVHAEDPGAAPHLNAFAVKRAIDRLGDVDLFFVENLSNLEWPPASDLGVGWNVTVVRVDEAPRLILEAPSIFAVADLIVLSGSARTPEILSSLDAISDADTIAVSLDDGRGVDEWLGWIGEKKRHAFEQRLFPPARVAPPPREP